MKAQHFIIGIVLISMLLLALKAEAQSTTYTDPPAECISDPVILYPLGCNIDGWYYVRASCNTWLEGTPMPTPPGHYLVFDWKIRPCEEGDLPFPIATPTPFIITPTPAPTGTAVAPPIAEPTPVITFLPPLLLEVVNIPLVVHK